MKKQSLIIGLAILAVAISGCGRKASTTDTSQATTVTSSGIVPPPPPGALTVSQFAPNSGNLNSPPTSVQISFNESSLDPTSTTTLNNYTLTCNALAYHPTTATITGGNSVVLSFAAISNLAQGSTCTMVVSTNVQDTSGTHVSGILSANYTIGQSSGGGSWNEAATATYTSTYGIGAGAPFYDKGDTNLALTGLYLKTGAYVDQLKGIWATGFDPNSNLIYGPAHGGAGGSIATNLMCPSGMRMTGVFGTYDWQVNSLGIVCKSLDQTQTYRSSRMGGNGTYSFEISCDSGRFATDIAGTAALYFDEIELGCR